MEWLAWSNIFSGGGPQKDGNDPHFEYGKDQAYPANNFDYHVLLFTKGAFPARTAQVMPYYGIPVGQTGEDVAFAFNKAILTDLLRDSLNFEGVICTDWGVISPTFMGEARACGVLDLPPILPVKKALEAGCDQFGGETVPELVVELVESGQVSEERIDESVRRILRDKFRLGLFDNPYVDESKAATIVGREEFVKKGIEAQAKSTVLLKNDNLLPLQEGSKIYARGMANPKALEKYGELVKRPSDADIIVLRFGTPYGSPRGKSLIERFFQQGRLFFSEEELEELLGLIEQKPTIVVAHLARPSILTEISEKASALLAEFGTSDEVMVEVLFG